MRIYSKIIRTAPRLLLALAALYTTSCSMTADSMLGSDIMPQEQAMQMRHLKFRGNEIISFDENSGEKISTPLQAQIIETRLFRTDSLISSNLSSGYLGVRRSDTLGVRAASFASSIIYMNAIDEDEGFGYRPIFDTMKLVLSIKDYKGDTLAPVRYKVFELNKSLQGSVLRAEDSISFINCDLSQAYDASKPIFEFTFPKKELNEGPATKLVYLEPTLGANGKMSEQTWDYIRRLMLIPENYNSPEWDGYATSGVEYYDDEDDWAEKFHGICIVPDMENSPKSGQGAFYSFDLSASGLFLQGRSRNPNDPALIQDTVGMYYFFKDAEVDVNNSAIHISHDYASAQIKESQMSDKVSREERPLTNSCLIEGLGGPMTEVYFTDEFLNQLMALEKNNAQSRVGINQCLLKVYVEGADYDWEKISVTPQFISILDNSIKRLGTYREKYSQDISNETKKNKLSSTPWSFPIIDYDYTYENSYGIELVYDGYLNRSRGCYTINITAYIQRLFNYIKWLKENKGEYRFDKADDKYESRVIYLGTDANSPYDFSVCRIQGMANDGSTTATAPMQIDLTYTLLK